MWFRAEQSRGLVKKVVLAMAEGLAGINIGNLKDEGLFGVLPQITGTVAFHGLIDTTGIPAKPGSPRPAYHALSLLVEKLADFSEVESLRLGGGIYAYRFAVRNRPVYVLWYDDGRRYLPGDKEPVARVNLPLPPGQYRLTETPTAHGPIPVRTVAIPKGGSEDEQVEFLMRFLELTKGLRLEFVNWAFLHDLPESSVTGFVVQRTHLGLGLRNYDGTPKKVWEYFRALDDLPSR